MTIRDELRQEKNMYMGVARMCEVQRLKHNMGMARSPQYMYLTIGKTLMTMMEMSTITILATMTMTMTMTLTFR